MVSPSLLITLLRVACNQSPCPRSPLPGMPPELHRGRNLLRSTFLSPAPEPAVSCLNTNEPNYRHRHAGEPGRQEALGCRVLQKNLIRTARSFWGRFPSTFRSYLMSFPSCTHHLARPDLSATTLQFIVIRAALHPHLVPHNILPLLPVQVCNNIAIYNNQSCPTSTPALVANFCTMSTTNSVPGAQGLNYVASVLVNYTNTLVYNASAGSVPWWYYMWR